VEEMAQEIKETPQTIIIQMPATPVEMAKWCQAFKCDPHQLKQKVRDLIQDKLRGQ